jgi:drug/metabolite transporter (DMT)-like permease
MVRSNVLLGKIISTDPVRRAYLELHVAVLLFGLTAILGDLIRLPALSLVWWRLLMTFFSLLLLIRGGRRLRQVPRRLVWRYMGIGVVAGLQWLTFYGAIKWANASLTLVAMATASFFTALLEPLLLRQRVKGYEMALGLFILPGMGLVVGGIQLDMMNGLALGLLSSFLAASFSTLNKKYIGQSNEIDVTFIELSSAWLFFSAVIPVYHLFADQSLMFWPTPADWWYLLVLALLCTTVAYVLALRSLRYLSAFASNLTVNLEPIYGIALAWVILDDNQELSVHFYAGVLLILAAVFSYPLFRRRFGSAER